ncbi:DUF3322 domain-containing protein [Lysobacter niastensis]|uniref:DUF3322 domain-containing protein n=1 Tax=Lysobacter niastensis TaxID=380629 RepID=UPI0036138599
MEHRRDSACLGVAWPELAEPLRGYAEWLAGLPDEDYWRVVNVVDWLIELPASGLYMRQLPIAGLTAAADPLVRKADEVAPHAWAPRGPPVP